MFALDPHGIAIRDLASLTDYEALNVVYAQFSIEMIRELVMGRELDKAAAVLSVLFHNFDTLSTMCIRVCSMFV